MCVTLAVALTSAGLLCVPHASAAPAVASQGITDPKLQAEIALATAQAQRIEATGARTAAPTVSVEILTADVDSTKRLVRAYGGTVTGDVPGAVVQATVPPSAAELIAAGRSVESLRSPLRSGRLPVPQTIGRPRTDAVPGTGMTVGDEVGFAAADQWHLAGLTGAGAKVGIVDYFDFNYWAFDEVGAPPDSTHQFCKDSVVGSPFPLCYAPDNINSSNGDVHGVAVAEIIKDMAPDAELFVASVGTVSDLRAAIDWFVLNGVTVMTRSLGSAYDGPGDGTGALDSVVDYAVGKGIAWFNSAGNDGYGAYTKRTVATTDASGYVNFGSFTADTWLRVDSEPGGCFFIDGVRWANDWYLPAAQRTDYRLEVYQPRAGFVPGGIGTTKNPLSSQVVALNLNADFPQGGQGSGGNVIDASQRAGAFPLEAPDVAICPTNAANTIDGSAVTYLRVKRNLATAIGSPADTMEVAIAGNAYMEQWVSGGSAAKPVVDSKNPGLVSVGALESDIAMQADDTTDGLAYYSSRGPTTDGRVKPDITMLSGFYSATFALWDMMNSNPFPDPYFHGTSSAAPGVAGVGALLMGAGLSRPGQPLAAMVRHFSLEKGVTGPDNLYGIGRSFLYDLPTDLPLSSDAGWYEGLDTPLRVLNTRGGIGEYSGSQLPHAIMDISITPSLPAVPITAVALNVTLVGPRQAGYVQVYPYFRALTGATSTLNVSTAGGVRPNFVIVPVGQDGKVSIYMPTGGDLIVDIMGYFTTGTPTHAAGRFQPLASPERWVTQRTMTSQVESVVTPPGTTALDADLTAGLVDALVVNLTAEGATRAGDVKAYETGVVPGSHSNVNFGVSAPSTNTAIVPISALHQFTMKTNNVAGNTVKVSVDVVGYITSATAPADVEGMFVPIAPTRAYRAYDGAEATTRPISITGVTPGEVLALSANLTVTRLIVTGYLTMYDGLLARPGTYNVTYSPGQSVANGAIFGVGWNAGTSANTVTAFMSRGGDVIIDVNGYFLKAAPPPP